MLKTRWKKFQIGKAACFIRQTVADGSQMKSLTLADEPSSSDAYLTQSCGRNDRLSVGTDCAFTDQIPHGASPKRTLTIIPAKLHAKTFKIFISKLFT